MQTLSHAAGTPGIVDPPQILPDGTRAVLLDSVIRAYGRHQGGFAPGLWQHDLCDAGDRHLYIVSTRLYSEPQAPAVRIVRPHSEDWTRMVPPNNTNERRRVKTKKRTTTRRSQGR